MIDNQITGAITSVGFPIVCCLLLFYFNKVEIEKLRETIEQNTKVLEQLKDLIKIFDRRCKNDD